MDIKQPSFDGHYEVTFVYNSSMREAIGKLIKARQWFECSPMAKTIHTTEAGAKALNGMKILMPNA